VRLVAPSRALGFDLGETDGNKLRPEAEAQALVEDAASLLFAQDALRGPAAQAYLALLQQISLKASPTRLFTAYGAFFRAQQATGARSFADHIVDEVIAGKGNPLAETCARGAREPSALELAAARADLDLLQRLCVSEATVLRWCERLAETATPRRTQPASWLAAAETLGAAPAASPAGIDAESSATDAIDADDADDRWAAAKDAMKRAFLTAPARPSTRAALRDSVAESWAWSDSLPALAKHWALHGLDEIGARSVLAWTGAKTKLRGVGVGAEGTGGAYLGRYGGDDDHQTLRSLVGAGVAWTASEDSFRVEAERRGGARGDRRGAVERRPAPRAGARPARGGQEVRGEVRHRRGVRARRAVRSAGPRRLARAPRDPRRGRQTPAR
jgi:hypothetical protein